MQNKKVYPPNRRGTSLIELLIYIAIMGIMTAAVTSFVVSNKKVGDHDEAINEVVFQGNTIEEIISQSVRNAISITSPALQASGALLSLAVDTPDNTQVFALSSGKVTIKRGSAAVVNLNSDKVVISSLTFKNLGNASTNGSINFQFTATYLNPRNRSELNYSQTFFGSASLR